MTLPASRTVWEEGVEPGREMVALGVALALTAAALDLLLTDRIGLLFDLGFFALCVGLALAVAPRDFFTVGVLPPLLMLSTFLLLAASRSEAIALRDDGLVQAVVSGLSHHSGALVTGYLASLAVLFVRQRVLRTRAEQDGTTEPLDVAAADDDGYGTEDELTRTGRGRRLPV